MVRPYSEDLRARVIAAVEEDGLSRREAARRFRVSESSAIQMGASV
jgi:putative transposase